MQKCVVQGFVKWASPSKRDFVLILECFYLYKEFTWFYFYRSDFMTLPFQACECYMANITPLQGKFIKLIVKLKCLERPNFVK